MTLDTIRSSTTTESPPANSLYLVMEFSFSLRSQSPEDPPSVPEALAAPLSLITVGRGRRFQKRASGAQRFHLVSSEATRRRSYSPLEFAWHEKKAQISVSRKSVV